MEEQCYYNPEAPPRCASLPFHECVDPYYCTPDCSLLTCKGGDGQNLFQLCATSGITDEQASQVCNSHYAFTPSPEGHNIQLQ